MCEILFLTQENKSHNSKDVVEKLLKYHCKSHNNMLEFDNRQQQEGTTNNKQLQQLSMKITQALSAPSHRNCEYFFSSTPRMSVPTLFLSTPTDAQLCTRWYMDYFHWAIPTDYRYPDGWLRPIGTNISKTNWWRSSARILLRWMVTLVIWWWMLKRKCSLLLTQPTSISIITQFVYTFSLFS